MSVRTGSLAKPTIYADTRFRSRTEAKWAFIFDYLGIKWKYEPKRFPIECWDGKRRRYIPDFYLPQFDVWIEVKPFFPKEDGAPDWDLLEYTKVRGFNNSLPKPGRYFLAWKEPRGYAHQNGLQYRLVDQDGAFQPANIIIGPCFACGAVDVHQMGTPCASCKKLSFQIHPKITEAIHVYRGHIWQDAPPEEKKSGRKRKRGNSWYWKRRMGGY